jgi:formylglycine-generating enzyme required for sulfatase activity
MTRRVCVWLGLLVAAATLAVSAWSQQRTAHVALVIGNANYPDADAPLPTTIKDARTLAEELRRNDFTVDLKENVGKDDMQRAIDAFTRRISSSTVALFYFSGFGIQAGRQTFLLPVNAQVWTEADARRDGIGLDTVLAEMHSKGSRIKIIIVDAARRNPFERRFRSSAAGLAAIDASDGTLAMFSAAPGRVVSDRSGDNSLFLGELVKELRASNLTAEDVFNRTRVNVSRASNNEQVPWVASSLLEEFSFARSRQAATTPAPAPPTAARPQPPVAAPAPAPSPAPPPAARAPTTTPAPAPPPPPAPTARLPDRAAPDAFKPGHVFRDCPECGEMVVVPAGSFEMGAPTDYEKPVHRVVIARPFAIGRYEVTFEEWDHCVAAGGCQHRPIDRGWGRENRPVINLSWTDAKQYVRWLSEKTEKTYRLPTEAEWEYAARGGTNTTYWWGRSVVAGYANCRECGSSGSLQTVPVGSFRPNPFGLYDTAGNAAEWVEDCWNDSYRGAPQNGSAWTTGQCSLRGLRGGAFDSQARYLGSAARFRYDSDVRYSANGLRVVRELP